MHLLLRALNFGIVCPSRLDLHHPFHPSSSCFFSLAFNDQYILIYIHMLFYIFCLLLLLMFSVVYLMLQCKAHWPAVAVEMVLYK